MLDAVDNLRLGGLSIPDEAVYEGLSNATWRARFEIIDREVLTIFDGAHNPEGIEAAVESVKKYFKGQKVCALSGVLKDKDYRYIGAKLSEAVSVAYTVTPSNSRALSAEDYAAVLRERGVDASATESIFEALSLARETAKQRGLPVVCLGSLYTYGEVLGALSKIKEG